MGVDPSCIGSIRQGNVPLERENAEQDREREHQEQEIRASIKYVYAIPKLNVGRHGVSFAGNLLRRIHERVQRFAQI